MCRYRQASRQQQQRAGHELRQLVGIHVLCVHRLAGDHEQVGAHLVGQITQQHAGLRCARNSVS